MEATQDAGLFTIGYEGRVVDSFVEDLGNAGVEVLVDVRELAQSRKRGFSKTALSALLDEAGIKYRHFKSLGSPRVSRQKLRAGGDFGVFVSEYADHLEINAEDVCALLEIISSGKRVALMCFERDHTQCHRNYLAEVLLEEAGGDFEVHHL